jgi:hypothetical protein
MGFRRGSYNTSVSDIKGPSGFYRIYIQSIPVTVYVNQEYDGGGWVMVLANRGATGGMNNLTYNNAVNTCNYRTGSGTVVPDNRDIRNYSLADLNVWIGTSYWSALAGRASSGKITVVQFVSGTNGTALSSTGSHNKRYRWRADGFGSGYAFSGATAISDETGTGAPGFYSYHAANGFKLTTYDNDQDVYGANCSTLYNNNPWWYGACWDGNYFAGGGGYADYPYWSGSGGDYYQYGAVYIK